MMKAIHFSIYFRDGYNCYQNNSGEYENDYLVKKIKVAPFNTLIALRPQYIHTLLVQTYSFSPSRIICVQSCMNNKDYTYL